MATGTLLSITISNFGPFAEPVTFSTVSDTSKKELLSENSFEVRESRYNKVSYIYGANGAGKSNFCKAIMQLQLFLSLSPILASNNPQLIEMSPLKSRSSGLDNPYKFNKMYADMPTTFIMEILLDGITYAYSFSTQSGKILEEKLTKKNKRTETILERTSPLFSSILLKSELKPFENNVSVVKENVLCLSMAAFLNLALNSSTDPKSRVSANSSSEGIFVGSGVRVSKKNVWFQTCAALLNTGPVVVRIRCSRV